VGFEFQIEDTTKSLGAKTFFPGSTVLDIATNDRYGMPLISAHFDKNVRFWDPRCDAPVNSVLLNGKVTSLILSPGFISTSKRPIFFIFQTIKLSCAYLEMKPYH
jgi:hypothetical protein